jgi:hypothetical protein
MIVIGTQAHGAARRRFLQLPNGFSYHKSEWLETDQDPDLSPTMFLIEQPAGTVLPTHFHRQNQFQVMVGGSGTLGRHEIGPIMVHYAGAYSGYGPLIAGPQGVAYFTIRAVFESGAMMVATDRHRMVRGPKRQEHSERYDPIGADGRAALTQPECVDLIALAPDRLAAQVWRLPAQSGVTLPAPSGSSGQFLMVLDGDLQRDEQSLARWETIFVSPDEPGQRIAAGGQGLEVLLLQVPLRAREYDPVA